MVENDHFDVRTITMGISLYDCMRGSVKETANAVYDKICKRAENLVQTGRDLATEYGIPIVNKRISITPASVLTAPFRGDEMVIAQALDNAAKQVGVDFLGG